MSLISSDTKIQLVINELTEEQYFQLSAQGLLKENELYLTEGSSPSGYDVGPQLDQINGETIDGLYFKAQRISQTKTALSSIIADNGESIPDKFSEYPQVINQIIADAKGTGGSIENAVAVLEYQTSAWFPDSEFRPAMAVSKNGTVLIEGTDYTVSYSNNTIPGTASAKAIAIGSRYTGQKSVDFTLTKCNIQALPEGWRLIVDYYPLEFSTDGREAYEPVVNGVYLVNNQTSIAKVLTQGTDYTVGFVQNTGIGTGKVVITGTGNYTGEDQSAQFVIHDPAYSISDFQNRLESNLVKKNDCIIAKYVKNDNGFVTSDTFKAAVTAGTVTPSDLEFIVMGVNTTPPCKVMYKSSDTVFSYSWISIDDLISISGIASIPVGRKLLSRTWSETNLKFEYAETSRMISSFGTGKFSYANNVAWSVPSGFTDSEGVSWTFCGYTATARAKWLVESNGSGVTAQHGSATGIWYPMDWLNSEYGSSERTQKPDSGLASSNGFILKLYKQQDFIKLVADSANLYLTPSLGSQSLGLQKSRVTMISPYEAGMDGTDGIARYYSDNAGRVQHTEDGIAHEIWTRSASVTSGSEQTWYGINQYGEIKSNWPASKTAYVLPLCTFSSGIEYTPPQLLDIQYTASNGTSSGTGSTSGQISVDVTDPTTGFLIEYSLDQVSWTTTNPTITRSEAGRAVQTVYFRITATGYKKVTDSRTVTLTVYQYVDDLTITGFSISTNENLLVVGYYDHIGRIQDTTTPETITMSLNTGRSITFNYSIDRFMKYLSDIGICTLMTTSTKSTSSHNVPLTILPDRSDLYKEGYIIHCLSGYAGSGLCPTSHAVTLTDVQ